MYFWAICVHPFEEKNALPDDMQLTDCRRGMVTVLLYDRYVSIVVYTLKIVLTLNFQK